MPFKLQNNRMIEVKHETVFGRCVEVSGIGRQWAERRTNFLLPLSEPLYDTEIKATTKKKSTELKIFLVGVQTNCLRCGTIFDIKSRGCPYCRKKRKARVKKFIPKYCDRCGFRASVCDCDE